MLSRSFPFSQLEVKKFKKFLIRCTWTTKNYSDLRWHDTHHSGIWKKVGPFLGFDSCIQKIRQAFWFLIARWIHYVVKFICSEKAIKFCEISTLLLSNVVPVKSKVEISQNSVAFSEYMNFTCCFLGMQFKKFAKSSPYFCLM